MESLQIFSPDDLANILAGINGLILLIIHRNKIRERIMIDNPKDNISIQKTKKIDVKVSGSLRLKINF